MSQGLQPDHCEKSQSSTVATGANRHQVGVLESLLRKVVRAECSVHPSRNETGATVNCALMRPVELGMLSGSTQAWAEASAGPFQTPQSLFWGAK